MAATQSELDVSPSRAEGSALVVPGAGHLPALDGLRGLAILLVLTAHLIWGQPRSTVDHIVNRIQVAGWVGVDLFFVLSGFLITGVLLDSRTTPGRFRIFYFRRVLRIFPLYFTALAFFLLILPALFPGVAPQYEWVRAHQAWYWLYLNNILVFWVPEPRVPQTMMHFWSLALEEQFYLVWPFLVFGAAGRHLLKIALGLFAVTVALGALWWVNWPSEQRLFNALASYGRMGGLLIGAALAIVARNANAAALSKLAKLLLAFAMSVIAIVAVVRGGLSWDAPVLSVGVVSLQLGFASLLVFALQSGPATALGRLLRSSGLRATGRYSYAIYVVHPTVALLVHRLLLDRLSWQESLGYTLMQPVAFALIAGASFAAALGSWHLLERHFLALKDVVAPRTEPRASRSLVTTPIPEPRSR